MIRIFVCIMFSEHTIKRIREQIYGHVHLSWHLETLARKQITPGHEVLFSYYFKS